MDPDIFETTGVTGGVITLIFTLDEPAKLFKAVIPNVQDVSAVNPEYVIVFEFVFIVENEEGDNVHE